jgi:hypothetical protein
LFIYDQVKAYILHRITIPEDDLETAFRYTDLRYFKKGDHLIRIDEYCRFIGFIEYAMIMIPTYRRMIQNLVWATGYNVIIALPLAAGVLYKQGILLSPAAGAALMALSTIVVAINASLLKVK